MKADENFTLEFDEEDEKAFLGLAGHPGAIELDMTEKNPRNPLDQQPAETVPDPESPILQEIVHCFEEIKQWGAIRESDLNQYFFYKDERIRQYLKAQNDAFTQKLNEYEKSLPRELWIDINEGRNIALGIEGEELLNQEKIRLQAEFRHADKSLNEIPTDELREFLTTGKSDQEVERIQNQTVQEFRDHWKSDKLFNGLYEYYLENPEDAIKLVKAIATNIDPNITPDKIRQLFTCSGRGAFPLTSQFVGNDEILGQILYLTKQSDSTASISIATIKPGESWELSCHDLQGSVMKINIGPQPQPISEDTIKDLLKPVIDPEQQNATNDSSIFSLRRVLLLNSQAGMYPDHETVDITLNYLLGLEEDKKIKKITFLDKGIESLVFKIDYEGDEVASEVIKIPNPMSYFPEDTYLSKRSPLNIVSQHYLQTALAFDRDTLPPIEKNYPIYYISTTLPNTRYLAQEIVRVPYLEKTFTKPIYGHIDPQEIFEHYKKFAQEKNIDLSDLLKPLIENILVAFASGMRIDFHVDYESLTIKNFMFNRKARRMQLVDLSSYIFNDGKLSEIASNRSKVNDLLTNPNSELTFEDLFTSDIDRETIARLKSIIEVYKLILKDEQKAS